MILEMAKFVLTVAFARNVDDDNNKATQKLGCFMSIYGVFFSLWEFCLRQRLTHICFDNDQFLPTSGCLTFVSIQANIKYNYTSPSIYHVTPGSCRAWVSTSSCPL